MLQFKRPMLAASLLPSKVEHTDENILAAMEKLRYPVLATLKKDGIRALRMNGTLLSRTLKVIPNKSIRERSIVLPGGFDMELWNPELPYDKIESIVMSREHVDSDMIQFHLLDAFANSDICDYKHRMFWLEEWHNKYSPDFVRYNIPGFCADVQELFECFLSCEKDGEGICFRTPDSPYKQGRSTLKEQYLVKLSRYVRTELTIVGFKEQQENGNADKRNEVGYMKRTTEQGNMFGKDTLGAFLCVDYKGESVDVGTGCGLTDRLRKEIWDNREHYINKQITVKHKPFGAKDVLRHPIFVGFREPGY